jgi:hypothetical protein
MRRRRRRTIAVELALVADGDQREALALLVRAELARAADGRRRERVLLEREDGVPAALVDARRVARLAVRRAVAVRVELVRACE